MAGNIAISPVKVSPQVMGLIKKPEPGFTDYQNFYESLTGGYKPGELRYVRAIPDDAGYVTTQCSGTISPDGSYHSSDSFIPPTLSAQECVSHLETFVKDNVAHFQ
jgi:hypothetical protein